MFNDIVSLLTPDMGDPHGRRALVNAALFGCPVLDQIDWSGAGRPFTVHLMQTLLTYGECEAGTPAIVTLLAHVRDQKGVDKHPAYAALIARVMGANQPESNNQGGAIMDTSQLITFLIGVGVWAQTELSEIWKLRRQQAQDKPSIELKDKSTMEAEAPAELAAAGVDPVQAARITAVVEIARGNIFEWVKEKEELDQLVNSGEYDPIKARRRKANLDQKIEAKMAEIPQIIQRLGIIIERE